MRNQERLMEAQQARTTPERIRTRTLLDHDTGESTMLKRTIRYARYVLSTLATVGFANN